MVLHLHNSRGGPGGEFRLLALGPRAHRALETYRAALQVDMDPAGVDQSIAPERLLDFLLDVLRRWFRHSLIKLVTPVTPVTRRTAFSASSRW